MIEILEKVLLEKCVKANNIAYRTGEQLRFLEGWSLIHKESTTLCLNQVTEIFASQTYGTF